MMGGKRSNTFDIHTQHERKSGIIRLQGLRKNPAPSGSQELRTEHAKRFSSNIKCTGFFFFYLFIETTACLNTLKTGQSNPYFNCTSCVLGQ